MANGNLNEADTRARSIDTTFPAAHGIERVAEAQRPTHREIHREQSGQRIDILDGHPLQRGNGRVDYLLRTCGQAAPLRREGEQQRAAALARKERLRALRGKACEAQTLELQDQVPACERRAREVDAKAQGIEDAIHDLKAVKPREVKQVDSRTPAQLLEAIASKGLEVDAALAQLQALLEAVQP